LRDLRKPFSGLSSFGGFYNAIPLVRVVFGDLIAIGLYLTYVGRLAKPVSPSAKNNL
jgi:hypothetical protein